MSKKPIFIEKIREFMKNDWVDVPVKFVNLLQATGWIYEKTLSDLVKEIWKEIKGVNWNKNATFFMFALFLLFVIVVIYLYRKKIWNELLTKSKSNLRNFSKSVNKIVEELKRRRGGDLSKSVLLYRVGSHKYGYNGLNESRQKEVYWLFRTNQEDEWSERVVIREKLVDQVSRNFNLERDEKNIRKYFRPIDELKRKLEWVNKEIRGIMTKNPYGYSEAEQKRLEELFVDEKRLKTELYYSEMFSIIF